jgi:regulatory protein
MDDEVTTNSRRSRRRDPSEKPKLSAKDRALGLLAVRWRSRRELEDRLRRAGYEPEDIERAMTDLESSGLVDDERFARETVLHQSRRRMAGDRAIRSALFTKGVSAELTERMLAESDAGAGGSAEQRAFALAETRARRLSSLEPEAAFRRLFGLLVRRGHAPNVARDAARRALAAVMPPAAFDEDGPVGGGSG